ncbi:hypothetical protein PV328_001215 [Microctonus aethiopoides]|uniref:ATP-dependent RNA helicase n=1 Tax=Microctonus aethiopoides TaxID=144406 RepID=A0AA39FX37_9HYME|nr:hypothetical protein PV328_001215 [Microctonus aethiopoides]
MHSIHQANGCFKINLEGTWWRNEKLGQSKMIATAHGIHIPHFDNVINLSFPAKSKLFVHRVGRCAPAGRTGTAYSIVSDDDHTRVSVHLHLFLGAQLKILPSTEADENIKHAIGKIHRL